jgi:anti-sigma factor RsiW
MTECSNGDMRDLLPDYVAGTLAGAQQAAVDAHVTSCADCRDETALLRVVRSARPRPVAIDVARIVAALPRRTSAPTLHLVRDEPVAVAQAPVPAPRPADVIDIRTRRRPSWRAAWRIAAAIAVTVIGSWSLLDVRRNGSDASAELRVADGSTSAAGVPRARALPARSALGDSGPGGLSIDASPRAGMGTTSAGLSLGDLSEYSDEDLQRVLERLEQWDGATSADPLPTLPIVSATRGTL